MTWRVEDCDILILCFKVSFAEIYCNTMLTLFIILVHEERKFESGLSKLFRHLLHFIDIMFPNLAHFVQNVTHERAFAGVHMAYDDQVNILLQNFLIKLNTIVLIRMISI